MIEDWKKISNAIKHRNNRIGCPYIACDVILKLSLMAVINLSDMAEFFCFFFHKTVTCDVEKAEFFLWLKVFKEFK